MSRNQNSHFSLAPQARIPRSRFDMSFGVKTTFNVGKLVPLFWREVLPGDTFKVSASILTRLQTLIVPLMDNMYLDLYYFYTPNRILWKHWQNFMGQSDEPWFDADTTYTVPQIKVDIAPGSTTSKSVKEGTVADYLGMPLPNDGTFSTSHIEQFNHLPIRAYCMIWNEWFRDQNTQALTAFNTEDNSVNMNNVGTAFYGGELLPVNKYRDYFTSCLPMPQRGEAVTVAPSSLYQDQYAPVVTYDYKNGSEAFGMAPLRFGPVGESEVFKNSGRHALSLYNVTYPSSGPNVGEESYANTHWTDSDMSVSHYEGVAPINLGVDISHMEFNINELREAFALQRYLEQSARAGTRYVEFLDSFFGVTSPDARLQRPEYLGGQRVSLNINQAVQQSETSTTPLGNIGAYSLTTDSQFGFEKSFVEHGIITCVACVRYDHSYQNGYNKEWLKKDFEDYYLPTFANIGEQPVENIEIYAAGDDYDHEVFGFQEAWSSYRYSNNIVTGQMRSNAATSLDYWHLADDYQDKVYLDDEWRMENGATVDRAIAVSQRVSDQVLCDVYFSIDATRPLPMFSVPGLDLL